MIGAIRLEAVLKRDRLLVLAGLGGICLISWAYLFYLAQAMDATAMTTELAVPRMQSWGVVDVTLMFVMWAVMMVAMMAPSAAPMLLMFVVTRRRSNERRDPVPATGLFLLGYVLVWTGFSAAATLLQWGLHSVALLSPMMVSVSPTLGGILLLAAGVFQWTPLKHACLDRCRSPLGFLMTEWRDGARGALVMGLRHGGFCVGCCWALIGLLFVLGVMNLAWIGVLTGFVLLEKLIPAGHRLSRITGLLLIVWGAGLILGPAPEFALDLSGVAVAV